MASGNKISCTYESDGQRTTKTVNDVEHKYYYSDGFLRRETYGDITLYFFYDANGVPFSILYNRSTLYYYITNLEGDVIKLVDTYGNTAAMYKYDPFGREIYAVGSHAQINPLRYRSYYYDTETEMYYVSSRYYDPEVGRFISADSFASTGQGILGFNMFAYCNNNPINMEDYGGTIPGRSNMVFINDGGYSLPTVDLTEELDEFMLKNADKLEDYKEENGYIEAAFYFYQNVKDGGDLDIKLQDEWTFEEEKNYVYRDRKLRFDDPGNINFGYVGAVLFSEEVLCIGAGVNQISKYGFVYGDLSSYFDDPRDQAMIRWGYEIYQEVNQ